MLQEQAEKVRENRLRRMARRQGLALQKSRLRDPRALGYGCYRLVNVRTNYIEYGAHMWDYSVNLDEIEAYLTQPV